MCFNALCVKSNAYNFSYALVAIHKNSIHRLHPVSRIFHSRSPFDELKSQCAERKKDIFQKDEVLYIILLELLFSCIKQTIWMKECLICNLCVRLYIFFLMKIHLNGLDRNGRIEEKKKKKNRNEMKRDSASSNEHERI